MKRDGVKTVEWTTRAAPPSRLFPVGQVAKTVQVDLEQHEAEWFRDRSRELAAMSPGPERTAMLNEIQTLMEMKALLGAELVEEALPPSAGRSPSAALPDFDGATYVRALDHERLGAQLLRVGKLMGDGSWRTLAEIASATSSPEASASARLRDLRKWKFGGHTVERDRLASGQFRYRVVRVASARPWGDEEDEAREAA